MPAKLEGPENEPDGPANGLEAFALELKAQREWRAFLDGVRADEFSL
jgi:hypothetical protein